MVVTIRCKLDRKTLPTFESTLTFWFTQCTKYTYSLQTNPPLPHTKGGLLICLQHGLHKSEPDCHILYKYRHSQLYSELLIVSPDLCPFLTPPIPLPPPPPSWERAPMGGSRGGGGRQIPREGGNTQIQYTANIFLFFIFWGEFLYIFSSYYIQHCFICRSSDSTVPTDAGIEPRTVATGALAVRRSNH